MLAADTIILEASAGKLPVAATDIAYAYQHETGLVAVFARVQGHRTEAVCPNMRLADLEEMLPPESFVSVLSYPLYASTSCKDIVPFLLGKSAVKLVEIDDPDGTPKIIFSMNHATAGVATTFLLEQASPAVTDFIERNTVRKFSDNKRNLHYFL